MEFHPYLTEQAKCLIKIRDITYYFIKVMLKIPLMLHFH